MAYTIDSKSIGRNTIWVQVPSQAPKSLTKGERNVSY